MVETTKLEECVGCGRQLPPQDLNDEGFCQECEDNLEEDLATEEDED